MRLLTGVACEGNLELNRWTICARKTRLDDINGDFLSLHSHVTVTVLFTKLRQEWRSWIKQCHSRLNQTSLRFAIGIANMPSLSSDQFSIKWTNCVRVTCKKAFDPFERLASNELKERVSKVVCVKREHCLVALNLGCWIEKCMSRAHNHLSQQKYYVHTNVGGGFLLHAAECGVIHALPTSVSAIQHRQTAQKTTHTQ